MATINIGGKRVTVDDSFLSMSPEQQNAAVEEISSSLSGSTPAQTAPAPRSAAQVQAEYDALPWYQKAGQAADDVVRTVANGMTFGYADKLAGYMNDTGTQAERAKTQEAMDRAGSAGTAGEIVGAVATPALAGASGLGLMGRFGSAAVPGVGGFLARSGLAAAEGAGYGALMATGNDRPIKDEALLGAIFGAGGNAVGEGLAKFGGKIAEAFNPNRAVPTIDEVRSAANSAYTAADQAGVMYTPQMVDRLRGQVTQGLADMGYDPALQPGAAAVVRRLEDLTGQNVTLTGLDTLRKVASNGYDKMNPSNNKAVAQIINAIDDAIANPAAGDVLGGDAQAGAAALAEARRLWGQTAKANEVASAQQRAVDRAASTGKGANIDNATRQNLRPILERGRGYTPDEQALLQTAVRGGPAQNFLRSVGALAPTGVVSGGVGTSVGAGLGSMIGSAIGVGPSAGASVGAFAVPAIGQMAKSTADAATARNVQNLLDVILAGGQKSNVVPPPNAGQRYFAENSDLLSRIFGTSGREAGSGKLQQWRENQ